MKAGAPKLSGVRHLINGIDPVNLTVGDGICNTLFRELLSGTFHSQPRALRGRLLHYLTTLTEICLAFVEGLADDAVAAAPAELATSSGGLIMNIPRRLSLLLLIFFLFTISVPAQKRRGTPAKTPAPARALKPGPTLENLLAVDTYRVHVEIRGVGQLLKNSSFNDVIDPIIKLASPPKEFQKLLTWLTSQSDSLTASRMMVAFWSVRPNVPSVLIAIEFASSEEAQKFEPRLQSFLPKLLPTPTQTSATSPTSVTAPAPNSPAEKKPVAAPNADATGDAQPKEAGPSFVIKHAGSLVYVSNVAFTFKSLRPTGSKLLTEDPSYRRVHDRFATESVLVFVDSGGMQREDEERRRKMEKEELKLAQTRTLEGQASENDEQELTSVEELRDEGPPPPMTPPDPDLVPEGQIYESQTQVDLVNQNPQPPNMAGMLVGRMAHLIFSGPSILPDAVGLALAFEPDNYAVRLLLVNESGVKGNPIPFMPQLISGPHLTLEAAGVVPADTEFFVSLSLDYQQIHDSMVKALADQSQRMRMTTAAGEATEESPFAEYERKSGIKLKEDLFPLLGNEVALILPLQALDVGPNKPVAESTSVESDGNSSKAAVTPMPSPIIAIAVRDREGMRALLPNVFEAFGLKGASLLAQSEKRGDTEIVSYAGAFAYAFMGNFVVLSTEPKEIRRLVDSYLNHDTLASNSHYRNFTRWQPRQLLGQFYLSPKLMDSYRDVALGMDSSVADQLSDMFSRLSPTSEPLTYALSNEGLGPMHELRMPRNLVLVMLASMFSAPSQSSLAIANETIALSRLRMIASAENTYRATNKHGSYGSLDQLVTAGLFSKEFLESSGYRIEVHASGSGFEATAVPVEYGKTGKRSFFIDQSSIIRGGDHGGGPATIADKPVQ